MNYNIIAYLIYTPVIAVITIQVGWMFYKNGEVFLFSLIPNNTPLVKNINNLLLIGYYLVNLGYAIFSISQWDQILTLNQLLQTLSNNIGGIMLILAILHYNNIFWLKRLTSSNYLNQ